MAYLRKNQPCYVCLASSPNEVYCAGAALSAKNAFNYCASVEQYYRRQGYELVQVDDTFEQNKSYSSIWVDENGGEYLAIVQISALME